MDDKPLTAAPPAPLAPAVTPGDEVIKHLRTIGEAVIAIAIAVWMLLKLRKPAAK